MQDRFGREINYARISVTDKCNLRCRHCLPEGEDIFKFDESLLRIEEIVAVVTALMAKGITKIRFTGGEPLFREDIVDLAAAVAALSPEKLCITTNGVLLKDYAQPIFDTGVKYLNVTLNTLDRAKFADLTRTGSVDEVIDGIIKASSVGFERLKLNVTYLKGINETEISTFMDFAKDMKAELRLMELTPKGFDTEFFTEHYAPLSEIIEKYDLTRFEELDDGAAKGYKWGAKPISLITTVSDKPCEVCNCICVTEDGYLAPCAHLRAKFALKPYLYNLDLLESAIEASVLSKPYEHNIVG